MALYSALGNQTQGSSDQLIPTQSVLGRAPSLNKHVIELIIFVELLIMSVYFETFMPTERTFSTHSALDDVH